MADKKISALTGATTPLAGTEVLPIVQSGSTVKVAVSDLTAGRPISATEITLTAGNVIPANGYGVNFAATPNTGTSELFADYEEGTWTPSVDGGSIAGTSIVYTGTYTKIGRVVYINLSIVASVNDLRVSSYVVFGGLPYSLFATSSGSVTSEDIDLTISNGFAQVGSTVLVLGACGSLASTQKLFATAVGYV
jgi:hypothetical protein